MLKIWSAKYAMSSGKIQEMDAKDVGDGMVSFVRNGWTHYLRRGEWHQSFADAEIRAQQMRTAKLVSLRKQIKKLEAIKFTVERLL